MEAFFLTLVRFPKEVLAQSSAVLASGCRDTESSGRKLRVNGRNSDLFKLIPWDSLFSGPILKLKQKKLTIGTLFRVIGASWTD